MTPDPPPPVCQAPDGRLLAGAAIPAAVLPGSFNPLHRGHRELAAAAGRRLGAPIHFELSAANVDKPDLPADEIARRLRQFVGFAPVWVTRAATFEAKADQFPGAAFVLGWDTAVRLVDVRYYGGDPGRRDVALRKLLGHGCRVLVGGRADAAGRFRTWDGADVAGEFRGLFEAIPEAEFRADVSSTELRGA
jgi:hypothetical protein